MANRLYYLDNLKGLLIILVIRGHAIQFTLPDYENVFAFRLIYSFHMPLFFFISGFLANRGGYKHGVIRKRALQLLLPFVTWAIIAPVLKMGTFCLDKSLDAMIYPDNGLWFLYNLFIYSAIASISEWLCEKYKVSKWLLIIGCYCALGLLMILFHTKFNCTQLCYHFVFYFAGYLYKHLSYVPKASMVVMGGGDLCGFSTFLDNRR